MLGLGGGKSWENRPLKSEKPEKRSCFLRNGVRILLVPLELGEQVVRAPTVDGRGHGLWRGAHNDPRFLWGSIGGDAWDSQQDDIAAYRLRSDVKSASWGK